MGRVPCTVAGGRHYRQEVLRFEVECMREGSAISEGRTCTFRTSMIGKCRIPKYLENKGWEGFKSPLVQGIQVQAQMLSVPDNLRAT